MRTLLFPMVLGLGGVDMDVLFSLDGNRLTYDIVNGPQTFLLERK